LPVNERELRHINKETRMIYNNIILTVQDEANIDAIAELLTQQGTLSRQEPGCARFEVYHSKADPKVFMLIEQWESEESLNVHRKAKSYLEVYQPKVLPLVERVPHPSDRVL
jgi:quinol monooxygenase YgiN